MRKKLLSSRNHYAYEKQREQIPRKHNRIPKGATIKSGTYAYKNSLRDLWDKGIKCSNIHIIGVPEGKGREIKELKTYLKEYD